MEIVVLETIRELGLELQITFNKGAVMILPPGVNKATGLAAALAELGLSRHNVVGVGDAENDHAFLSVCGCAVAVANALPAVKDEADLVTAGARGDGVVELVDRAAGQRPCRRHRHLAAPPRADRGRGGRLAAAARSRDGAAFWSPAFPAAASRPRSPEFSSSWRRRASSIWSSIPRATMPSSRVPWCWATPDRRRKPSEAMEILDRLDGNLVLNLLGVELGDRPGFLAGLLPELCRLRARTGRPHWIVIDEAHHMLPAARTDAGVGLPHELRAAILVTVHPDQVAREALALVETVFAVGAEPGKTLQSYCAAVGEAAPPAPGGPPLEPEEALFWRRGSREAPRRVRITGPRQQRRRHTRKYAEGELGPDRSFYFRGPEVRSICARRTSPCSSRSRTGWTTLPGSTISRRRLLAWARDAIKDEELAADFAAVERESGLDPAKSRARIKAAIERRYTGPASAYEAPPGPGRAA